jgi:catechol 2,3-dioxygenase-like lactoylglutathione lyase family enzyme
MAGGNAALGIVSPFFVVTDVPRAIAFYCDALGFELRHSAPEGAPFFAIVGRDAAQLFLKSERGIAPQPNPSRHPHLAWDAFVYADDPDAVAAEFEGRGATFATPLQDTHDGLRGFAVDDADGYRLFFGQPR